MSIQQFNSVTAVLLLLTCGAAGCRGTGRSPFAIKASDPPVPVQNQVAMSGPPAVAPAVQTAAANDAISQQIATESRALSDSYSIPASAEVAKYASASDTTVGYSASTGLASESSSANSPPHSGSFTSSSSGSSSGCSSGCCPH